MSLLTSSLAIHRAALVDGPADWRDAVADVLSGLGIEVVAQETNAAAAIAQVQRERADLLVVHVTADRAGEGDGRFECLRLVRERRLDGVKTIVFSDSTEQSLIDGAFEAGAAAYVVATAEAEDVASAIRQAFAPSLYFPSAGGARG